MSSPSLGDSPMREMETLLELILSAATSCAAGEFLGQGRGLLHCMRRADGLLGMPPEALSRA